MDNLKMATRIFTTTLKLIITTLIFVQTSCCLECKECQLILKYEWKVPHKGFDIINMSNDSLIGSKIYYKDNPEGIGNVQFVKDSGHYVINKINGLVKDSIYGFVPKTAENKYLWVVGQTEEGGIIFGTKTSQFTVATNFNGYRIVLQEWYKNIRQSNNELNSVLIFKGGKKIKEYCLPRIFDFTFDNESFYINSDQEIYKFNFEETVKGL